jgi:hypothetical protein
LNVVVVHKRDAVRHEEKRGWSCCIEKEGDCANVLQAATF